MEAASDVLLVSAIQLATDAGNVCCVVIHIYLCVMHVSICL